MYVYNSAEPKYRMCGISRAYGSGLLIQTREARLILIPSTIIQCPALASSDNCKNSQSQSIQFSTQAHYRNCLNDRPVSD